MKAEPVSALRGRWWVPAGREALLPVPRTMNRKQNTMKTYILRDPKSVQPQKPQFVAPPDSQTAALVECIVAKRMKSHRVNGAVLAGGGECRRRAARKSLCRQSRRGAAAPRTDRTAQGHGGGRRTEDGGRFSSGRQPKGKDKGRSATPTGSFNQG